MRRFSNIFWLGTKEVRSLLRDTVMVLLIIWAFGPGLLLRATGHSEAVNNASIAFVDEDRSALSRALRASLTPPYFQTPVVIEASDLNRAMDESRFTFVVVVPPHFEADIRRGRQPELQLNVDATAVIQAATGASYLHNMLQQELANYTEHFEVQDVTPVALVSRRAFNPNGTQAWFESVVALLDQISVLTIALTGAAFLREREHGTIEHLLVMPLSAFEIATAKVLANGLAIMIAFATSMAFVVEWGIGVPIAGSRFLLFMGAFVYLFSAAAIGIFLGTVARTMAQFALLMLLAIMPMMMLSGGMTPIESQPAWLQPITNLLPSRHFMAFSQAIVFRGAGLETVWPQLAAMGALGGVFFAASLALFRRSISTTR
ncbi:MAG: ABC transporter permease [Deltaproteobacteria bacterium]|jgi:ABC-2 type transport system permease protein|nr:ABC transporter permease [Deltaproteobacteria bacterium]